MNRRDILEAVVAGRLTPQEADRLLTRIGRSGHSRPGIKAAVPARAVRLTSVHHAVRVVADPHTAEIAVVEGAHEYRREGDVILVSAAPVAGPPRPGVGAFARAAAASGLLLRINPGLALEAEVTGSTLEVRGVRGPVHATVRAGTAELERLDGPLDLRVTAGAARVHGAPAHGDWSLRVESGSMAVVIPEPADVAVHASGRHSSVDVLGDDRAAVLGSGARRVDIEALFSDVRVSTT